MEALLDATDDQMATLADLVDALSVADATVNAMMAARDGLLALAGRLAVDIAAQGDHPDRGDMTTRAVAAEIGQLLRVSDRTVERRMGQASNLVDGFPTVWRAQGAGRISAAHAHVIIEAGAGLDTAADRERFAAAVLPLAEEESPNRLRPLATAIAARFHERSVDERHRAARTQRRVWTTDRDDAMADLHLRAPAVLVHAVHERLSQMAHLIRTENRREAADAAASGIPFEPDSRGVDEIRADLLTDLALSGSPTAHDSVDGLLGEIRGRVEISVPVLTLMGDDLRRVHDDHDVAEATDTEVAASDPIGTLPPAMLDGAVPVDVATARLLAGLAVGWDRVLTHPVTGALLAVDRYRPSEQLRRHLRSRDRRCRFPTCGLRSHRCDLDHTHAASTGGATTVDNLSCLCRRHHILKHHSPWQAAQREGGVVEWTSPAGRTYVDRPPAPHTVVFAAPAPDEAWTTAGDVIDAIRAPF